jgi:SAM-dependent methyltransferase
VIGGAWYVAHVSDVAPAPFEDLLLNDGGDLDAYFDPREFLTRGKFEDELYWHLYRREVILETLQQAMPEPVAPLIEIGCGAGTVTTHLNANGYRVDYADVHGAALVVARTRAEARLGNRSEGLRFIRFDVCRQRLPGKFRGVFLFDVLEHLPDDVAVLKRVRPAFEPGPSNGLLMFTVPAFPMLWSPWDDVEKHKRRYTAKDVHRLTEQSGFAVERLTYFFAPLFVPAAVLKGLRVAGNLLRVSKPVESYTELTEATPGPLLNALLLRVLSVEKAWLRRRHHLPFGTSLICVARPR